jgi:Zn ribbon nucleic-acid-binding protein
MPTKICPQCQSKDLGDRWCSGRKLQHYCRDCGWEGNQRVPELKKIQTTKFVTVDQFNGFVYEVFDKYGHISTMSETFRSEAAAKKSLLEELENGLRKDNVAGPYTGVLWPAKVKVKGKKFIL